VPLFFFRRIKLASVVDICNQALSHLGDSATVASIDPPEGSAQAEHCARFYFAALGTLLEMHPWAFATRRATLAAVANPSSTWAYAYALPSNAVNLISILAPDASDDYSASPKTSVYDNMVGGAYTPQEFSPETDDAGNDIILTNQADAVLRYTVLVSDTTKFSPLFVEALTWLLASKLAGPVLKGEAGMQAAQACTKTFVYWLGKASDSDASQRRAAPRQQVGWMNAR
jgi:hypothetical protein